MINLILLQLHISFKIIFHQCHRVTHQWPMLYDVVVIDNRKFKIEFKIKTKLRSFYESVIPVRK